MRIKTKPMGMYQTNCYIVEVDGIELIIDPGIGADDWVKKSVKNPVAILNTHGHFDHVWSNSAIKEHFKIPIYIQKGDAFMLQDDPFSQGVPKSSADVVLEGDVSVEIEGIEVSFLHFPGHTPGCAAIVIEDAFFSGDFIFAGSIGRVDFPYSNPSDMKRSIKKVLGFKRDYEVYPGHGPKTKLSREQKRLPAWLNMI